MRTDKVTLIQFELLGKSHTRYTYMVDVALIAKHLRAIYYTAHLVSAKQVYAELKDINANMLENEPPKQGR